MRVPLPFPQEVRAGRVTASEPSGRTSMKTMSGILLFLAATLSPAQDGDQAVWDAIAPYEKTIRGISGALELCDILRKWLGLPKLEEGDVRCTEIVSTSNNAARIKWAISQGFPHWKSQDMPTPRGSDSAAVACPEHGSHGAGEFVCYTWI